MHQIPSLKYKQRKNVIALIVLFFFNMEINEILISPLQLNKALISFPKYLLSYSIRRSVAKFYTILLIV